MPEFDPKTRELLTAMLLVAGLLVLIAVGIQVITVYRRRLSGRAADSKAELAESFREAYEQGELSRDEYRQIQEALERDQPPPQLRLVPRGAEGTTASGADPANPAPPDQQDAPSLDVEGEHQAAEDRPPRPDASGRG